MKKICFLLFFLFLIISMLSQTAWTVQTVSNTRMKSNDVHVSDPDGFLSDSAEMNINTALCAIRDKADVFVVTLASIGNADPKLFATGLFNYWGIGDVETDNGILLLFVEDQHALEFETGYGAEETLTDAKCAHIFNNSIVPFFKVGDYEGGLCAGVARIVDEYGGEIPIELETALPGDYDYEEYDSTTDIGTISLLVYVLVFFIPLIAFIRWLVHIKDRKKLESQNESMERFEENGTVYISDYNIQWSGSPWERQGCLRAMTFGLSILLVLGFVTAVVSAKFINKLSERSLHTIIASITIVVYFTLIALVQNLRALRVAKGLAENAKCPKEIYKAANNNFLTCFTWLLAPWVGIPFYCIFKRKIAQSKDYHCPTCGSQAKECHDFQLSDVYELENRLKALKFTPYQCTSGHVFVVREKGDLYSKFSKCNSCGAYTMKHVRTKVLAKADYINDGKELLTYECQYCGFSETKNVKTPKLVASTSSGGPYSSGGRSYRSSGGSFGGGRSGGGGYSGRW